MLKKKNEDAPLVAEEKLTGIKVCGNHFECKFGKGKLYVGKDVVIAKETIRLPPLNLTALEYKAKGNASRPESFEVELILHKRNLKGSVPRLILPGRRVKLQDGDAYVSLDIGEGDAKLLREKEIRVDKNGFIQVAGLRRAVELTNTEIKIEDKTREEIESLLNFEKALHRIGEVMNDAIRLPDVLDRRAKQEELLKRRLG